MDRRVFAGGVWLAAIGGTAAQARRCPPARSGLRFYIEEDAAEKWRWQLKSHGDIIADSGQGYETRGGCADAIDRVKGCYDAKVEG